MNLSTNLDECVTEHIDEILSISQSKEMLLNIQLDKVFNISNICNSNAHLSAAIILLRFIFVKKGHNSKTIAFRVIPLVLQLQPVIMSTLSKFGVDNFNTF